MAAATESRNPFKYTAPGELGCNRESMLANELILRVSWQILLLLQRKFVTWISAWWVRNTIVLSI